jgi:threonine dehydratase
MSWLYRAHGLRTEPSGAITTAALLEGIVNLDDNVGDIVIVLSGRNIDQEVFDRYLVESRASDSS